MKKFLSFFGIIVSWEKKHPVHLSGLFFVWIGILFVLFIALNVGLYSYSTNPNFCNSCHIMKPYFNAWDTSTHKGIATCVDCHYPPADNLGEHLWHKFQASAQVVKYITRTYSSKPFAEISDASCLRSGCHSTRLLEGKVNTPSGIKFDHRPHLTETRRGRQLRCVSCHSQIVIGTHVEVTYSSCYLCHFKELKEGEVDKPSGDCLTCHDLPSKSFKVGNMSYDHANFVTKRGVDCKNCHLEVVQGKGIAKQDRCITCHNQPEKLARYGETPFIHETHVTKHHVACLHCHEEIQHGLAGVISNTISTPATHLPSLNFDCSFCHENKHAGQLEMYSGKVSSLGLPDMP
ncbi:MAG: NapC/NirT family cytochrome c, partial [bacterium]|nr:NapC/NirT family cytochrome c [bacterium]